MLEKYRSKELKKDYFRNEKLYMKILGISFNKTESIAYRLYTICVLLFINCIYMAVQLLDSYEQFTQDGMDSNSMVYQFATILGTAKNITVIYNRARIGKIMEKIEAEPFAVDPNDKDYKTKENLIKDCVFINKIQRVGYGMVFIIAVTPIQLNSLRKRVMSSDYHDWTLPFGSVYPINLTHSPIFEICWLHQMVSIQWHGWVAIIPDLIFASAICHLCFQFKFLQMKVRRIVENSYQRMCLDEKKLATVNTLEEKKIDPSKIPWIYLQQSLKESVDYHLAIIDLADETEDIFSGLILVVCFAALSMMGIMVYRSSMVPINDPAIVRCIWDILTAVIQTFLVCFWGERLIHESTEMANAAYEANFVGSDLRFQKGLALIINRSQTPTKLTLGKFNDACMPTFNWILQSTYTMFMLVRNTNMQEEHTG